MTIDPTRQSGKPNKRDYSKISNQIILVTGLTSEEIVMYFEPPYGYTLSNTYTIYQKIEKN